MWLTVSFSLLLPIQPAEQPSPARTDAMDVDPIESPSSVAQSYTPSSPAPVSAAPTVTGFSNLFFESMSPVLGSMGLSGAGLPKKRRSVSPERSFYNIEDSEAQSSSPALLSSPSQRKFDRFASTGSLFRKTSKQLLVASAASSNAVAPASKRARRPTISALVQSDRNVIEPTRSAFPILSSSDASNYQGSDGNTGDVDVHQKHAIAAPRRAFSAMMPSIMSTGSGGDTSSDVSIDASPAAQAYAKRQSMKTLRRRDGTDDFRPLTGATALKERDLNLREKVTQESINCSPSLKYMAAGMPGFGDNEAHGKILPCHRVAEDGLMRINCQTVRFSLCVRFSSAYGICSLMPLLMVDITPRYLISMSSTAASITNIREDTFPVLSTCTPLTTSSFSYSDKASQSRRPAAVVMGPGRLFSSFIVSSVPSARQPCESNQFYRLGQCNDICFSSAPSISGQGTEPLTTKFTREYIIPKYTY